MTELSFAKSFLSILDTRPVKYQSDYVADPKTFVPKGPYTLPRNPTAMKPPDAGSGDDSEKPVTAESDTVTLMLRSARNPKLDIRLAGRDWSTSMLDLKAKVVKVVESIGEEVETGSVKILYKKKPCADSRTIKEVLGDDVVELSGKMVEFGVMVMGYRPKPAAGEEAQGEKMEGVEKTGANSAPAAQGSSGAQELEKDDFWNDLKGFLCQRLRDEGKAEEVFENFRQGWKRRWDLRLNE